MTHTASHIIIHSLRSTVSTKEGSTTSKVQVWHVLLACALIGFLSGLAL